MYHLLWKVYSALKCYNFYSIAHKLNQIIFNFRRDGFLETVGPAGEP